MKCPACNSEAVCKSEPYQYKECGLDNIVLEGIDIFECQCGEKIVCIPAMPELHSLIGLFLIKKKSLLNGKEIRFLRKNIGLTAAKLSGYLGVDNATISRWENDNQSIAKSHDRFLRLLYLTIKGISKNEIIHLITEDFIEIQPQHRDIPDFIIPLDKWSKSISNCISTQKPSHATD